MPQYTLHSKGNFQSFTQTLEMYRIEICMREFIYIGKCVNLATLIKTILTIAFIPVLYVTIFELFNVYEREKWIKEEPYLISNNICSSSLRTIFVVHSATTNFPKRESIRRTWGNKDNIVHYGMNIIFLLGQPNDYVTQEFIESENQLHHDICLLREFLQNRFTNFQTLCDLYMLCSLTFSPV